MKLKTTMTQRRLLAGASLMLFGPTAAPRIGRAQQAQWVYKYANNLQETHPMNIRAREMGRPQSNRTPMAVSTFKYFRATSWVRTPTR